MTRLVKVFVAGIKSPRTNICWVYHWPCGLKRMLHIRGTISCQLTEQRTGLPHHPANPELKVIQRLWYDQVATPPGKPPINKLTNRQGYDVPFRWLTIAWQRPPNLGNFLSYRKLENRTGLKVSLFLPTTWYWYAPNFLSRGSPPSASCSLLKK